MVFITVCDDNCKEVILSPEGDLMVCTISGVCSDTLLVQTEPDADGCYEEEAELEAEVFTDKSRLGTHLSICLSHTPPFPNIIFIFQHK